MMQRFGWLIAAIMIATGFPARAESPYSDMGTAEGYAWARIKMDAEANFTERCHSKLDPHSADSLWNGACREVSAEFVRDVLTNVKLRDQIGQHGVQLRGARIVGNIDLTNAEIAPSLLVIDSEISGVITMTDTRLDRLVDIENSVISGGLYGNRLTSKSALMVRGGTEIGRVDLRNAQIEDDVDFSGADIREQVDLGGANVKGGLYFGRRDTTKRQRRVGGDLYLRNARIAGGLELGGTVFEGPITADGISVGGNIFFDDNVRVEGTVNLVKARVEGQVILEGANSQGKFDAHSIRVGDTMFIEKETAFNDAVDLHSSQIGRFDVEGGVLTQLSLAGRPRASCCFGECDGGVSNRRTRATPGPMTPGSRYGHCTARVATARPPVLVRA